jgi:hypothetical protein
MRGYEQDSADPLGERAKRLAAHGAFAWDLLMTRWRCDACATDVVDGPAPMAIPLSEYRSLEAAGEMVRRSVAGALAHEDSAPECDDCGRAASLVEAVYHFHHSGLGRDIVLVLRGNDIEHREWSHESGYAPLRALDDGQQKTVARDAILRAAQSFKEHDEHQRMVATLMEALEKIPDEPMLMRFMPRLHRLGALDLAMALAEAQRERRPDNPEGHFWSGQTVVEAQNRGHDVKAMMPGVGACFLRAVELRPDYPDAEIGLANLERFAHNDGEAERLLRAMLARHPDHAVGNYTLGLVLLADRPEEALACFSAGEAVDPKDADYPRGCARALYKLGRVDEALAAAQRAKLRAPRDGRIDSVIAEILAAQQRRAT